MAPLPEIGNCIRVTLNWNTVNGVTPRNVFHLITNSEDVTQIGSDLDDAFTGQSHNPFFAINASYELLSYLFTVLDGDSAGIVVPAQPGITGEASGQAIPQVAAVLSLRSNQRGPRGRGRLYLGPIGEDQQANGILNGSLASETAGAWAGVNTDLAASDSAASIGVASYTHADVHGVTHFSMRPQTGTQRRRLDQLI